MTRLTGWKAIAGHFGRGERTVMRWADERAMPVRRRPGASRSPVYAFTDELDRWLARHEAVDLVLNAGENSAEPVVNRGWRRAGWGGLLAAGAGLAGVVTIGLTTSHPRSSEQTSRPSQSIEAGASTDPAYLAASYDLDLRTPGSLRRAVREFGATIARHPDFASAYARLGETYLLLREYADFPENLAFERAGAAASAAARIDPRLAAAHRVIAFVAFWGHRDIATARREFATALKLAPNDALTLHWYATALSGNGEPAAALRAISEARRLDPQSTALLADYAMITYLAGRQDEGLGLLRQIVRDRPEQLSAYDYLAEFAFERDDFRGSLDYRTTAARLRGDHGQLATLGIEQRALDHGGAIALLDTMFERQRAIVARTRRGYYGLARLEARSGKIDQSLASLDIALANNEVAAVSFPSDSALNALHHLPAYSRLAHRRSLVF